MGLRKVQGTTRYEETVRCGGSQCQKLVTHISSKLYVHTWMKCRHVVAVLGKKGPLHVVKAGQR
jgi:hypothetical protein